MKKVILIVLAFIIGLGAHIGFENTRMFLPKNDRILSPIANLLDIPSREVVGFLPYWLLESADKDYSKYLTTLSYFALTIDADGTIQKLSAPTETEPGWLNLKSGNANTLLENAKKNNVKLSLSVFSVGEESIGILISDPIPHAQNLVREIAPIMKTYGFTDLNLDVESVLVASDEARQNFTTFTKEIKKNMDQQHLGTLTVDASPTVLVKNYLINLADVSKIADKIVIMTYDYHYPGSSVTGPVSPINGVETEAEFDTETAIKLAIKIMPRSKILIGAPLYGYEWETLSTNSRSAVIPGTGLIASNRRIEDYLASCNNCTQKKDEIADESFFYYLDTNTNTYHQFFYPDEEATMGKVNLAEKYNVSGLALWALGYDGKNILNPIEDFLSGSSHQK